MVKSTTRPDKAKPYDRPSYQLKERAKGGKKQDAVSAASAAVAADDFVATSSKGKGKSTNGHEAGAEAGASLTKAVNVGAPSQAGQSSRKGKKAWRKNVDIVDIERGLEEAREEERVTGGKLAERRNEALFEVDVTGDATMAANLARTRPKKPLRSLAILSERSAVPSLTSRASTASTSAKSKAGLTPQEKARLRRLALKEHRPDAAPSLAIVGARPDASIDPWAASSIKAPVKLPGGFGEDFVNRPAPQTPSTLARARLLRAKAIAAGKLSKIVGELPDAGTSYNPSQESHAALLESAVQEELAKLEAEAKVEAQVAGLGQVVVNRNNGKGMEYEYAEGMNVGPGEDDDDVEEEGEEPVSTEDVEEGEGVNGKSQPQRKTQAQRNRALRRKLAEQERLAAAAQKRLNASAGSLASFKRAEEARLLAQAEALKIKRQLKAERDQEKLVHIRAGEKVGKYKVPKGDVAVQLGEDLAETLRQIKPEGNAFKDRFLSLQKKGLIEPRLPINKRSNNGRTKEFEKHAYKRFV